MPTWDTRVRVRRAGSENLPALPRSDGLIIWWKSVIKGHAEIDVSAIPDRKGGKQALDASLNVPPPLCPIGPLPVPCAHRYVTDSPFPNPLSVPLPPTSRLPPSLARARSV